MKLTLDQAQDILIDKESLRRGTLTDQVINVAYKLVEVAKEVKKLDPDWKGSIGHPYNYWADRCPDLDNLSSAKKVGNACVLADWLFKNETTI